MKKVLVTGGAGFIGSVIVKKLIHKGYEVIVYDNLTKSHSGSVNCTFIKGNLADKNLLDGVFEKFKIDVVIHCAGFIEAEESMKNPYKFFKNNVFYGINLLDIMVKNNVKKIIFSSSAGVYAPKNSPLIEDDLKEPQHFYGETKLMFEKILKWYDELYGIKSTTLRYFNAFGTFEGLGEKHNPETHLIPLILFTALGKRESISIFGADYDTPDGTCIRDYIHVEDIAKAHILTMENLKDKSKIYNLGTGKGNSVKEMIKIIKKISGKNFKVLIEKRRVGDPPILIADSSKIKRELGWVPEKDFGEELRKTLKHFMSNL